MVFLVSAAVVVTGVFVLVLRLVDHRGLGGVGGKPCVATEGQGTVDQAADKLCQ
jgi:hypothetical protein